MSSITLSQVEAAGIQYNPETGVFTRDGIEIGTRTSGGYIQISFCGESFLAHRLAWFMTHGVMDMPCMDHKNGFRDDNRLENLRACTFRQNGQNKRRHREGGVLGASEMSNGKFRAQIRIGKRVLTLGTFSTAEECNDVYMAALDFVSNFKDSSTLRGQVFSTLSSDSEVYLSKAIKVMVRKLKAAQSTKEGV